MVEDTENIQAVGIDTVSSDKLRQELRIGFTRADRPVLFVHLPVGTVSQLILRVQSLSAELDVLGEEGVALAQPVRLQEARPFGLADSRKGLMLKMENFEVPLLLTAKQIALLKNELEELPDLKIDKGTSPH